MSSTTKIAINGVGRIGRTFLRDALKRPELEIVALNDLAEIENIAYLLKYDTVYGQFDEEVSVSDDDTELIIGDRRIPYLSVKDPAELPWGEKEVDVVVEATGLFTEYEKARAHIEAGATRVVISAPGKKVQNPDTEGTVLMGVNDEKLATCDISSNASCTTNSAAPLVQILHEHLSIEKAFLNTVHGYTASQSLVDAPNTKDYRRGRAGAANMVPTSTGAAKATTEAITDLDEKFDGVAVRVPVPAGSLASITFLASKDTSVEEVNEILRNAADDERWENVFAVVEDPVVSSDILGSPYGSIADLDMTRVVDGNLVHVMGWYDNEAGYVHTLVEHVVRVGEYVK